MLFALAEFADLPELKYKSNLTEIDEIIEKDLDDEMEETVQDEIEIDNNTC